MRGGYSASMSADAGGRGVSEKAKPSRDLLARLRTQVLLCDGAMGTFLYSKGIPTDSSLEELNLSRPSLIRDLHAAYAEAGADILETNTFAANRAKLGMHGLEGEVGRINECGARLAREGGGPEVLVAGSVGPLGALIEPYGRLTSETARQMFSEQIRSLAAGGVDAIVVETFSNLKEALEAVRAARECCDLPLICQMTFLEDGSSQFGHRIRPSFDVLIDAGADVVGINCSIGPRAIHRLVVDHLGGTSYPLSVQPNAGYPAIINDRSVFLSTADYFRDYAEEFVELGVNIVGGCCGTTPEHTAAMAEVVRGRTPRRRHSREPVEHRVPVSVHVRGSRDAPAVSGVAPTSRFLEKLGEEFVVTVEVAPPRDIEPSGLIESVRRLCLAGVSAVNVAENPLARLRMSSLAFAHLVKEQAGVETILHVTCRDKNLLGLQSELLGAAVLGVGAVLALTGDPSSIGDFPRATSVFDLDSIGLVRMIAALNAGTDIGQNPIGHPTAFRIGVAVNPAAPDLAHEVARLEEKIEAGAQFAQTQPIFDRSILEEFFARCGHLEIPILVGLLPLRSAKQAEFLHNEVPGISIPDEIRASMRAAPPAEQGQCGVAIARELAREIREQAHGLYLVPTGARFDNVLEVLKY